MPVKSFPIQLKNFFVMCTTTLATVPNAKQSLGLFSPFPEVEADKPLCVCQTRWLSLDACVSRVIEQWDVLTQYFQTVVDQHNLLVSQRILTHLWNSIWCTCIWVQKLHCVCQHLSTGKEVQISNTLWYVHRISLLKLLWKYRNAFQLAVVEMLQILDPDASHSKFPSLFP